MIELHFCSFNHHKLISEIEKRPCLWNLAEKSYSDKSLKQKEWLEVAENYFQEDWTNLRYEEKQEKVEFLVKKWKSIRDYYIREKKKIHEERNSSVVKSKKKNPYFELLNFLDNVTKQPHSSFPNVTSEHTEDNYATGTNEKIDTDYESDNTNSLIHQYSDQTRVIESQASTSEQEFNTSESQTSQPKKKMKMTPFQECLLKKFDVKNDDDPNRHFLLSLVPEMSKMTERQNFQFRMGIMKVLNEVKYQLPDNFPNCTSCLSHTSESNCCSTSIVNDRKYPSQSYDSENE